MDRDFCFLLSSNSINSLIQIQQPQTYIYENSINNLHQRQCTMSNINCEKDSTHIMHACM